MSTQHELKERLAGIETNWIKLLPVFKTMKFLPVRLSSPGGTATGEYLNIYINGVQRKIALLLP